MHRFKWGTHVSRRRVTLRPLLEGFSSGRVKLRLWLKRQFGRLLNFRFLKALRLDFLQNYWLFLSLFRAFSAEWLFFGALLAGEVVIKHRICLRHHNVLGWLDWHDDLWLVVQHFRLRWWLRWLLCHYWLRLGYRQIRWLIPRKIIQIVPIWFNRWLRPHGRRRLHRKWRRVTHLRDRSIYALTHYGGILRALLILWQQLLLWIRTLIIRSWLVFERVAFWISVHSIQALIAQIAFSWRNLSSHAICDPSLMRVPVFSLPESIKNVRFGIIRRYLRCVSHF